MPDRLPFVQGTLVGLLAAFSYELSILHTASRLTSADAFRTLHALYRERTHPVAMSTGGHASISTMEGASPDVARCSRHIVFHFLVEATWAILRNPAAIGRGRAVLWLDLQCAFCSGPPTGYRNLNLIFP